MRGIQDTTQCIIGDNHAGWQNRSEAMNLGTRILIVLTAACLVGPSAAETITYEYDELHRLIHVTYDDGAWIRYEYDAVGNRVLDVMNSTPGVGYLYASVAPPGSGSVLRAPDDVWYDVDESIVLTPVPVGECVFDHWSGDDVPPGHETDNPLTITMSSYGYMHVVAHFDSPAGHMDEDCDDDDVPDGCEWADTNGNEVLDDCDPLIDRSVLTLEPECEYGEIAPDQFFEVWNAGLPDTLLEYTITVGDCSPEPCWLWVDPPDGISDDAQHPVSHTVHYDGSSSLDVGQHTATITISDPGAGNNEQTIDVILEVTGRAAVCRDVQTLNVACTYGEDAADQFFDVWNCGLPGTQLDYMVTWDRPWLWCDPDSGTSTEEHDQITVHFDSDELPAGQHFATITVSDPDAAYSPQTVLVVLTVACPADGWLPWDMNYDGFVSIIGDVPPFVDCVYFADCYCPAPGCLCPGDCNASGFLSIIGDVQCFVDCVYFGDCETRHNPPPPAPRGTFTIGGAVYTDLDNPLGSGLEGVRIRVIPLKPVTSTTETAAQVPLVPDSATFPARPLAATKLWHRLPACVSTGKMPVPQFSSRAEKILDITSRGPAHQPQWNATSGTWGLWQIDGLRPGRYIVTASAPGYTFDHVQAGVGTGLPRVKIVVGPETEAANQSIQFLAWPEPQDRR
ncbi:MAG: hypothetical protein KAY37_09635 [Phycisphaerae bacterium]|nr:hypothetical protein [Phycisphaerae bacterium]